MRKEYTVIYAEPTGYYGSSITHKEHIECEPKDLNSEVEKKIGWGSVWFVLDGNCTITEDTEIVEDNSLKENIDPKIQALMLYTGLDFEEVRDSTDNNTHFHFFKESYSVYTDEEADEALVDYIDDFYNQQDESLIPGCTSPYFNYEKWFADVKNNIDRGSALASYDSIEHTQKIDDIIYYIYRIA